MQLDELMPDISESPEVTDNSGIAEIHAAMDKITELESKEPNASEDLQEEKIDEAHNTNNDKDLLESPKEPDAKEDATTSSEKKQAVDADILEVEDKPKDKSNKLWLEKKLKFKAMAERDAIALENAELKKMLGQSLETSQYHYSKSIEAELERAKELQGKALDEGNRDAYLAANEAYNKALIAKHEADRWNAQQANNNNLQEPQAEEQQEQKSSDISPLKQAMAQEWLDAYPELNPASNNYDKNLATKVGTFINNLDANISQSGQREYYFSPEYFDTLDNYVERAKASKVSNALLSANNVAGVKKSYQSNQNNQLANNNAKQVVLTAEEKIMAANAGVSEKDWLKFKIEELNKGK